MNDIATGIYIRVSTEEQAKDGFSIHAQKNKLTKYAEVNEWNIYDYYIDDGISGKNLIDRPQVTKMLEDVKSGKINNVLVYKLDRLTRSVKDLINLIEIFENYGCCFNSVTEKIDTSNAVGRMFVKIIGIFAEFERENLAERVSFGYEQKTKEGNYTNTNGVYGYDYIIGEKRLVVNEIEKKLVNQIYDEYIEGNSYLKIAKNLNKKQVPTKRGGKWASSTIKSILSNPLYLGKVRYGVTEKNKDKSFTVEGKNIEPIISKEKWEKANNIIKIRQNNGVRRYPSENSYYFHTIKCGKCGAAISARQQTQKGKTYITYRCNNSIKGMCPCKGFSHKIMENVFLGYLDSLNNLEFDEKIIEKSTVSENHNNKQKLNKKIKKLENKKKIIKNEFINDLITLNEYKVFTEEINTQIKMLNESIKTLSPITDNQIYNPSNIKNIVTNIKINWEFLTNKEKRQFLERFVDVIKVRKENNQVIIDEVKYK